MTDIELVEQFKRLFDRPLADRFDLSRINQIARSHKRLLALLIDGLQFRAMKEGTCEVCGAPEIIKVPIPPATFYLCLRDLQELVKVCEVACAKTA